MSLAVVIVVGYLAGAIPFSYIAGKVFAGIDLRTVGSGNLGATNAFRQLGPWIGLVVLVADIAKGFLPVYFAPDYAPAGAIAGHWLMLAAAFASILGHMFSVFVRFQGGKGVATTAGAFLALAPVALLGALIVFLAVLASTRIVSLASISAAAAFPLAVYLADRFGLARYHWSVLATAAVVGLAVIVKHRSNIKRLLAGQEPALSRGPE